MNIGPLIGAITALKFSKNPKYLYTGSGTFIQVYDILKGEVLKCIRVFEYGCIHGIIFNEGPGDPSLAVVWGQKSVAVFEYPAPTVKGQEWFSELAQLKGLSDHVWEARLIEHKEAKNAVALGLACNVIEVWDWREQALILRVASEVRCMLWSVALKGTCFDELQAAVGTAFGQVVLWYPSEGSQAKQILTGHEGVVFKVVWAQCTNCLASVSDDRTVRVWAPTTEGEFYLIFTGWGHAARLWDVAFYNEDQNLITVSEDATALRWQLGGEGGGRQIGPALVGHSGKHIWCVNVTQSKCLHLSVENEAESDLTSTTLAATGGNDGSIKLWDLASCRHLNFAIPAPTQLAKHKKEMAAMENPEATSMLIETDEKKQSGLGLGESGTTLPVKRKKSKNSKAGRVPVSSIVSVNIDCSWWIYITQGKKEVQRLHVKNGEWQVVPVPVELSSVSAMAIEYSSAAATTFLVYGGHAGDVAIIYAHERPDTRSFSFKGHDSRVMKIHIQAKTTVEDAGDLIWIFTSSVDGVLKCWKFEDYQVPETCCLFQTHSLQRKGVTMALSVNFYHRLLFVGTNKGHIHMFSLMDTKEPSNDPVSIEGEDKGAAHLTQILGAHGHEQVSCLAQYGGLLFSAGNDGYIHAYCYSRQVGEAPKLWRVQTFPSTPISTVSKIWIQASTRKQGLALFAAGFQSSQFMVIDLFTRQQWIQVEAGGWRRPHTIIFEADAKEKSHSKPGLIFGFTSTPSGQDINVLTLHQSQGNNMNPPASADNYPSFGNPFHGRSVWAVTFCGLTNKSSRLKILTAGEDCSIKLSEVEHIGKDCYGIKVTEHCAPHKTSIRAVAASTPSPSSQLLVTGGGKLTLKVWRLVDSKEQDSALQVHNITEVTVAPNASQDHRILSVAVVPLAQVQREGNYHLIATGDSEGRCSLFVAKDSSQGSCQLLCSFFHDGKPVLSCSLQVLKFPVQSHSHIYLACGSTTGLVAVFYLGHVCEELEKRLCQEEAALSTKSFCTVEIPKVATFTAHQMGVNCMSTSSLGDENMVADEHQMVICSGGDDQAINVSLLAITSHCPWEANCISHTHPGASGSALKGIKLFGQRIYAVGYDQRLNVWQLKIDSSLSDVTASSQAKQEPCNELSLIWRSGCITSVTDVSALDVTEDKQQGMILAVISGQGVQIISCSSRQDEYEGNFASYRIKDADDSSLMTAET